MQKVKCSNVRNLMLKKDNDYGGSVKNTNYKVVGATCLIAGTTIGAGMIALPLTSATLGFGNSAFLLISMWLFMFAAAVQMIEISQNRGDSIAILSGKYIHPYMKYIVAGTLSVLFWALLAAYISGSGSILNQYLSLKTSFSALVYVLVFAGIVLWKTSILDYINRGLFFLKIVTFVFMALCLLPFIHFDQLNSNFLTSPISQRAWFASIPIFFTAFGFHGSIPTVIEYLDGNKKDIYKSIILGSLIPLVVYLFWQFMILGVLDQKAAIAPNVTSMIQSLIDQTKSPYLHLLITMFTFLAITTSFLGVALGMYNHSREWFPKVQQEDLPGKKRAFIKASLFTFMVPILFAIYYPEGFIAALGFASISLSLLSTVFPALVGLKLQSGKKELFKKIFYVIMFLSGLTLIIVELYNMGII
ncbi:MAG: hypothetical protein C0432_00340 [Candidatus Puniceispirillum sp.]|nr:hypothetical protein [Candidatus Pelagibacter sp.]MBA4282731.1 hypothetical protein [Candidatus Puniceispirillum sp.]